MKTTMNSQITFDQLTHRTWDSSIGCIGQMISFFCANGLSSQKKIPPFVIGFAYSGEGTAYLITLDELNIFFQIHNDSVLLLHSASSTIPVIENETGISLDSQMRNNKIFDIAILWRLLTLATKGKVPTDYSLTTMTSIILGQKPTVNKSIDANWGIYRIGKSIKYDCIPLEKLNDISHKAVDIFRIMSLLNKEIQKGNYINFLTHKIQLLGEFALEKVSKNGMQIHNQNKENLLSLVEDSIQKSFSVLSDCGYKPKSEGNHSELIKILKGEKIPLKRNISNEISLKIDDLEAHRVHSKFIDAYLNYKEYNLLLNYLKKLNADIIHTKFTSILNTGRTSSSSPNIQNIPQSMRECFSPSFGNRYLIIDYAMIELCTLAQTCFDQFGHSQMKDLINEGKDLHRWFASVLFNKDESLITKEERQGAKAANFGFPGGLGVDGFIKFAKNSYNLNLTQTEATSMKKKWLDAFPEMREYLKDPIERKYDFSSCPIFVRNDKEAARLFKRIISGNKNDFCGRPYTQEALSWAFNTVLKDVSPKHLGVNIGSPQLLEEITNESITTKTGRVRGKCNYCQARNTPFQGLAADGAKIALYRLIRNNFKVVNFIHDEFLIEIPIDSNAEIIGPKIGKIVVEAMQTVVPDIKIKTEWSAANRWIK